MSELHPLDWGFMELEDTDRHISLGIGAAAIVEGPAPTRAEFIAWLQQRLDLAHHIRWTALPAPGDESTLHELIATELEQRLDRDHPLWQCVVVEQLSSNRWALIVKAHHSMVDGGTGRGHRRLPRDSARARREADSGEGTHSGSGVHAAHRRQVRDGQPHFGAASVSAGGAGRPGRAALRHPPTGVSSPREGRSPSREVDAGNGRSVALRSRGVGLPTGRTLPATQRRRTGDERAGPAPTADPEQARGVRSSSRRPTRPIHG